MRFRPTRRILLFLVIVVIIFWVSFTSPKEEGKAIVRKSGESNPDYAVRLYSGALDLRNHRDWRILGDRIRHFKQTIKTAEIKTGREKEDSLDTLRVIDGQILSWLRPGFMSSLELKNSFSGSGIVICVNDNYAPMAMATLKIIRMVHKCDLPIEVFYMGEEDLSEVNRKQLEEIPNTVTKDIEKIFNKDEMDIWGFAIKTFALLASSFRHAMLIDADVIFLKSPDDFFKSNLFKDKRALFYRDRTLGSFKELQDNVKIFTENLFPHPLSKNAKENRIISGKSCHQQESGVVLIDKYDRFSGLIATCLLNLGKARESTYHMNMYGDKETFWIGFEAAGEDYAFNPYTPGSTGKSEDAGQGENKICSIQLIHADEYRKPAWLNGALFKNKNVENFTVVDMVEWKIEPGRWEFGVGHMACLVSSTPVGKFSPEYLKKISMIKTIFSKYAEIWLNRKTMPDQLGDWSYKSKECDSNTYLYNNTFWSGRYEEHWRTIDDYEAMKYLKALKKHIKSGEKLEGRFGGMGIVFYSDDKSVIDTYASIRMLRSTGCDLEIEVWHNDELSEPSQKLLDGIKGVTIKMFTRSKRIPKGKNLRSGSLFAIAESSFEQVLYLDPGTIAIKDPKNLFGAKPFTETGVLMWPDLYKVRPDNPTWKLIGVKCVDEYEQDQGQLLVDKSHKNVLDALEVATFIIGKDDTFDRLLQGWKDIFRLVLRTMNLPFHQVRIKPSVAGTEKNSKFCGRAVVHYMPIWGKKYGFGDAPFEYKESDEEKPIFVHSIKNLEFDNLREFGTIQKGSHQAIYYDKEGCAYFTNEDQIQIETEPMLGYSTLESNLLKFKQTAKDTLKPWYQ